MCGEDGIKRVVYNMNRGHAGRGSKDREEKREDSRRKCEKQKKLYRFQRKTDCCISSDPSINVRLNLFILRRLI